jgi:uncharacterized protein (TIGR00288 family)
MLKTDLRIALLIDGDNAQAILIPSILKVLDKHGTCVIRRVYGDWTASNMNMSGWRELEQTHAIQLIQQSRYTTGKNATDIALVIDAMEILYSSKVDGFCIVSSDSDFTPLVIRLKDKGTTVIAVGKSTTSKSFVNACSLFITTDTLNPEPKATNPMPKVTTSTPKVLTPAPKVTKSAPKMTAPAPKAKVNTKAISATTTPDARPILRKAYAMTPKKDEWVFLGALGQSLREIDPKFKPKTYGQKLLSQLVLQYRDVFEIQTEPGKGKTHSMYIKLKT